MKLRTLGVVVNPAAGQDPRRNLAAAAAAVASLGPDRVLAGADVVEHLGGADRQALPALPKRGRSATQGLALAAAEAGADALLVVGGDGTLSDVATALHLAQLRCPIIGVGAGSINAGDLITCTAGDVAVLADAVLESAPVGAMSVTLAGTLLALAFNDVVVGTTIVGSIEGRLRDLSAAARLAGRTEARRPQSLNCARARVTRTGPGGDVSIAADEAVGSVVIARTALPGIRGKAIVGPVGLSAFSGMPGGCVVANRPLVQVELSAAEVLSQEPVQTSYASLGPQHTIELAGFDAPAVLCADGNPLHELSPDDSVHVRFLPEAATVLRVRGTRQ
jgi:NAD kinase